MISIKYGLTLLLVVIDVLIFELLKCGFFPAAGSQKRRILLCGIFILADYGILLFASSIAVLKFILVMAIFTLYTKISSSAKLFQCFFLCIVYLSLQSVIDMAGISFVSAIDAAAIAFFAQNELASYLLSFLTRFVNLFLVLLLRTWGRHHFHREIATRKNYLLSVIIPLSSFLCAVFLFQISLRAPDSAFRILCCVALLLFADLVSFSVLNQLEEQQQEMADAYILESRLQTSLQEMKELTESYENERRLTHDFQNQMLVIRGLLAEEKYAELNAYVDQVSQYTRTSSLAVSTHRIVADVLLNQKYRAAREAQIRFQVQLDDLSQFPVPDDALVILLSNLLDNAIEACMQVTEIEKRQITLKMQVTPDDSFLYLVNSVAAPVQIINQQIQTTKQNPFAHGYGLQNVKAIIESNHGSFTMSSSQERFTFTAYFVAEESGS